LNTGEKVLSTRIAEVGEGLNVREEGAVVPISDKKGKNTANRIRGPASPKELIAILTTNKMTKSQWGKLDRPDRIKLVRAYRAIKEE